MMASILKAEPEFWMKEVPKRVNKADLRLLSLKRPAGKVGPWLTTESLNGK